MRMLPQSRQDKLIHIIIEDDGVGLSKMSGRRIGGLNNIRTRASLIQAKLTAAARPSGTGTRLEIVLPAGDTTLKMRSTVSS